MSNQTDHFEKAIRTRYPDWTDEEVQNYKTVLLDKLAQEIKAGSNPIFVKKAGTKFVITEVAPRAPRP